MSQVMPIAKIRETFPDEWVTAQITEVDAAEVPLAGIVLIHSPDKRTVFQAVMAHLAKHPEAELYTFFTGELIPEGLHIAFPLTEPDSRTTCFRRSALRADSASASHL
jgi:hypothetical protein